MKNLLALVLIIGTFSQLTAQTFLLEGKVIDSETNEPVTGAHVYIKNTYSATYSDLNGLFKLKVKSNTKRVLITSFIGYKTDTSIVEGSNELTISLSRQPYQTDEVIVMGTRAQETAPATFTNVSEEEIEKNNLGQDIPYLLQQTPSVVSTSDGGTGIGYTGIRIRGTDASRINVTINGIPLNDPESHGVFWVNMPDFASSLSSIQVQRGVGTSTNGAGAFGATINLENNTLQSEAYGEINNSIGFLEKNKEFDDVEYSSRKHTVQFGSGLIDDKFSFEGRLSNIQADGYIDRATADLKSYYLSGGYYGDKTILKAITFGGKEITYQSWYGTPESRINNDVEAMKTHAINNGLTEEQTQNLLNSGRTYNYYTYDNQVDNYNQNHYQLHFSHAARKNLDLNVSLHYTRGFGYFEEYKEDQEFASYGIDIDSIIIDNATYKTTDLVRRRWLDNHFYGMTYSLIYEPSKKVNFTLGGGVNNYEGDHFGEVIYAQYAENSFPGENYYFSKSEKFDANSYMKMNWKINDKTNLLTDLQIRTINYTAKGTDNDLRNLDVSDNFIFFNPKVGLNYQLKPNTSLYVFGGIANREPNRADYTDQPLNTPKKDANKPERLYNAELGGDHSSTNYKLALNGFLMYYRDQLVLTGQLNDVGSPLRQNVDKSYRYGFEIQSKVKLTDNLLWMYNATISRNKIESFNELTYDYTNDEISIISEKKTNTDIAFSPNVISTNEFSYEPVKNVEIAWITRYVGEQYLDNTSSSDKKIDSYIINDLRLQYKVPVKKLKEVTVRLLVNNILNEEYSSNGYTYSYIFGEKITENFYYPQALRNYLLGLNVKF